MKRRVAQVITRMVPGGAQRVVTNLLEGLADEYSLELITGPEDAPANLREDLPGHVELTVVDSLSRDISPLKDVRALLDLAVQFRRKRYDLVHTHTSKAGLLGRFAAWFVPGTRVIHTPHGLIYGSSRNIPGVPEAKFLRTALLFLERLARRRQDALTTLSRNEARQCERLGLSAPEKIHTIYNGIEHDSSTSYSGGSGRSEYDLVPEDLVIVSVGRLSPEKGYADLARAFGELRGEFDNLRLLIAGSGSERQTILETVPEEYRRDVRLPGYVEEVRSVYDAGDVFVMPSLYEGFGLAILEAMRAGLPIVATNVGGIPELVREDRDGFLVSPSAPAELADGLRPLLGDAQRREEFGERARERAKNFTVESMIEGFRSLYRRTLGED